MRETGGRDFPDSLRGLLTLLTRRSLQPLPMRGWTPGRTDAPMLRVPQRRILRRAASRASASVDNFFPMQSVRGHQQNREGQGGGEATKGNRLAGGSARPAPQPALQLQLLP